MEDSNLKKSVTAEFLLRRIQLAESAVLENPEQPSFGGARFSLGVRDFLQVKRKTREARPSASGAETKAKGGGKGEPAG